MKPEVRHASAADTEAACDLARAHRFAESRFYRHYGFDFASDWLALAVERLLARDDAIAVLATSGGATRGFASLIPLEWESRHFGIPMGSVAHCFAAGAGAERAGVLDALLGGIDEAARERGLVHLAARADADDAETLHACERRGYCLMDTLVTYVGDAQGPPPVRPPAPPDLESATYRAHEFDRIDAAEIAAFEPFMRTAYRIDRFHADPHLPAERSDALYVAWMHHVFSGEWADGLQVIRRSGRMVGYCSFQLFSEIAERYGVRIIGRGLAGVLPEGRGGYSALTGNVQTRCPFESRFQEFDTQLQNRPTINVWIRHGMHYVRARHTLHRWLGDS